MNNRKSLEINQYIIFRNYMEMFFEKDWCTIFKIVQPFTITKLKVKWFHICQNMNQKYILIYWGGDFFVCKTLPIYTRYQWVGPYAYLFQIINGNTVGIYDLKIDQVTQEFFIRFSPFFTVSISLYKSHITNASQYSYLILGISFVYL